jgi:hypothetical protein
MKGLAMTGPTGAAFATLAVKKNQLIRKTLDGLVTYAPPSATALTAATFADANGLLPLPSGYLQVGKCTDDGAQFSRSVDTSTVTSWGDVEPSREDVKTDTTTLAVVCNETSAATLGLYIGIDLSTVEADATTGVLQLDKPALTQTPYMRAAAIGMDSTPDGEIYICRFLPSAKITDFADMQMQSSSDDALTWGVTLTSFVDDELGTSERWLFGGPGWLALLDDMGITQAGA